MMKKDILILDEPTASLDTENKEKLIEVLKRIIERCFGCLYYS